MKDLDEYELCEITSCIVNGLLYDPHGKGMFSISEAVNSPNFAGYLYEDGEVCGDDVRYFEIVDGRCKEVFRPILERIQSGDITIKRPYPNGSVVFKKGNSDASAT